MEEKGVFKINGFLGLLIAVIVGACSVVSFIAFSMTENVLALFGFIFLVIVFFLLFSGFTINEPNQAKVITFFGSYLGVIREEGFWFTVPFTNRGNVSLRVSNFNSDKLKVNDLEGNPIEIGAVVVWRVLDAAKAMFDVENYNEFVKTQSETGLRHIASKYPYDNFTDDDVSTLRQNSDEVAQGLQEDLQERLKVAGIEVIEARIMHLAYSSEIASAMLQRQQAQAVLGARKVIVEGAVSMVKSAIDQLSEQGVIELENHYKAKMVNNLMVALVSDNGSQPVINLDSVK